jgi:hypothetical protein
LRAFVFGASLFGAAGEVFALCGFEGEELCQDGQTYRCEKTGSELTPIFQNRPCVVNAQSLNGTWTGMGHQSPAGATGADWSITYGREACIDGGTITVRFFRGNLSWTWVGQAEGQSYNAIAVLSR